VVFVIVIFTLKKIHALVVLDLGQSHETKDYWNNDVSWNLLLEAKITGT
jgi:hypothetical protein